MAARITKEHRSWNMSRIRGKNTKPELMVRSMVHRMGYRFTVNGPLNRSLPGRPDLVLPKYKTVIFVHGAFWHMKPGSSEARIPKTRSEWWRKKLLGNAERDKRNARKLRKQGWKVIVIWDTDMERNLLLTASRFKKKLSNAVTSIDKEDLLTAPQARNS